MSTLGDNIRHLRKKHALTQADFANKIGVKRAVINTYEDAKAEPKLKTLNMICSFFKVNLDDLVNKNLSTGKYQATDISGQSLRILPITVSKEDNAEQIPLVPIKASAGYMQGYGDPDFVESLPRFEMPFPEIKADRTYRIFQTTGDSMLPVPSGAYIISEYTENWVNIQDDQCYVLLTKNDGVVYKRIVNRIESQNKLHLVSDNPDFESYSIEPSEIVEVWKAIGYTTFNLPDKNDIKKLQTVNLQGISQKIDLISNDVQLLKSKL